MFPDLSTVNTIAYDTETSGLDSHKDFVVGFVLTWGFRPEESKYFPIRHEGGGNLEAGPVIDFVRKTMLRTDLRVVMHNAAFDLWMSEKDGIVINGQIEDTGLNDPLIDENQKGYSLSACCERARVQAKKGEPMYAYLAERFGGKPTRDQMSNYWKLAGDDPMAVEYAEGDGTSTLQLWAWQQGQLDAQDLRRVWQVECDLIPVLHRARRRGVPIDVNELGRVHEQVKGMRAAALEKIGGINPRAPSDVGPYIASIATGGASDMLPPSLKKEERERLIAEKWDQNLVPFPPRTKPSKRFPEGQPSYSAKYLESFEGGAGIIRVRELAHLEDSFITPMLEKHLHNGKVYPNFWQLASDDFGTVTGRLSSSGPNLQQVTKRKKDLGRLLRRVFIGGDSRDVCEVDYSQAEYRIFAGFTGSEKLIRGYNEDGIDMHSMVASMVGIDRGAAKTINFAILYGAGVKKIAASLGISVAEAKALKDRYFQKVPEARDFMRKAAERAKTRGYVKTLLGRRRRYPDPVGMSYQAINSICQGNNAEMIKIKIVEVDDYLQSSGRGDFAASIHDALVSYLDPGRSEETSTEIMNICKDFRKDVHGLEFPVRMDLDRGIGRNWAIASYGEEKMAA